MKAQVKSIAPKVGISLEQLIQIGTEFEELKAESERIEGELAKRSKLLKELLPGVPNMRIPASEGRELGLVETISEKFDLAAAKKRKGLAKDLTPFIKVVESLDIKAARNFLGEAVLKPFLSETKGTQLRFLKPLENGEGEE